MNLKASTKSQELSHFCFLRSQVCKWQNGKFIFYFYCDIPHNSAQLTFFAQKNAGPLYKVPDSYGVAYTLHTADYRLNNVQAPYSNNIVNEITVSAWL